MQLLILITKKTWAAEFLSVKILASKKLVFSKCTWGKASKARALLKTVDSGTDQGLCWKAQVHYSWHTANCCHTPTAASPVVSTRPGENGYNLDQKNIHLTFVFLLGTKNTETCHGLEKMENIWIQVPRTILKSDRADKKGQSGIFVIVVFWVYRSFHSEVFRKPFQTFKNFSISFYTKKTQSQLKRLSKDLLMDMYLI